jgi:uncharacterized protein YjbJ (UPF0337 family)
MSQDNDGVHEYFRDRMIRGRKNYRLSLYAPHLIMESNQFTARSEWPPACFVNVVFDERRCIMSGKAEEVKGRVKEAAGVLTNDERLKQEGKLDQASGKIKQATEKVVNKVRDAVKGD